MLRMDSENDKMNKSKTTVEKISSKLTEVVDKSISESSCQEKDKSIQNVQDSPKINTDINYDSNYSPKATPTPVKEKTGKENIYDEYSNSFAKSDTLPVPCLLKNQMLRMDSENDKMNKSKTTLEKISSKLTEVVDKSISESSCQEKDKSIQNVQDSPKINTDINYDSNYSPKATPTPVKEKTGKENIYDEYSNSFAKSDTLPVPSLLKNQMLRMDSENDKMNKSKTTVEKISSKLTEVVDKSISESSCQEKDKSIQNVQDSPKINTDINYDSNYSPKATPTPVKEKTGKENIYDEYSNSFAKSDTLPVPCLLKNQMLRMDSENDKMNKSKTTVEKISSKLTEVVDKSISESSYQEKDKSIQNVQDSPKINTDINYESNYSPKATPKPVKEKTGKENIYDEYSNSFAKSDTLPVPCLLKNQMLRMDSENDKMNKSKTTVEKISSKLTEVVDKSISGSSAQEKDNSIQNVQNSPKINADINCDSKYSSKATDKPISTINMSKSSQDNEEPIERPIYISNAENTQTLKNNSKVVVACNNGENVKTSKDNIDEDAGLSKNKGKEIGILECGNEKSTETNEVIKDMNKINGNDKSSKTFEENCKSKYVPMNNPSRFRNTWRNIVEIPRPFIHKKQVIIPVLRNGTTFFVAEPYSIPTSLKRSSGTGKFDEDAFDTFKNNCRKAGISIEDDKKDNSSKSEKPADDKKDSASKSKDEDVGENQTDDKKDSASKSKDEDVGENQTDDKKDSASKSKDEEVGENQTDDKKESPSKSKDGEVDEILKKCQ